LDAEETPNQMMILHQLRRKIKDLPMMAMTKSQTKHYMHLT
jgi:hypothetical protein